MKKLLFTLLVLFVGICQTVTAQTFTVIDKSGNKRTFDVGKLDSITFQQDPPAFTIFENVESETPEKPTVPSDPTEPNEPTGPEEPTEPTEPTTPTQEITTFLLEDVSSFSGDPDFLFTHPDTVYVDGEGENFAFQLRTSVAYNYTTSADWLKFVTVIDDTDSLKFSAGMNPSTTERTGYLYFASMDDTMRDTVVVIQIGKTDSRYIDIDWSNTTLDSFNEESGKAQLTFTGDVPVMGDYDVVLLPSNGDYTIRLIDKVQQAEGSNTVTIDTRQGLMGNLFRNQKFTLTTEAGTQSRSRAPAYDNVPVYQPTKVEFFTGNEYVEVYNANKASRGRKAPVGFENEFFSWEYNQDGAELWSSGMQSLSWDKLNFNIGLKGLFSFDFGDVPFEKVRMGDLQHLKIALEGGFDMEMVLKYLVSSQVEWKKEWTLKEDVFQAKYTFMVGTVPVYISVGADLMAEVSLGASGEASITSGIKASNTVTYGVEWDAKDNSVSKIAECEKNLEMVGPDVDIKAHAEARATVYPQIEIGIYKVLCPTISPQPYIKAEADGRLVDNKYVAWNAGVSTGVDLGLGLSLDLFFWEWQLADIDPINVFDVPLVSLPDEIELLNKPEEEVLIDGKREVKYHVTNKINLTGKTYNAPGVLVHFEAEGGELEDEYGYTDKDGNVSAFFTLNDLKGGTVKAEVVLGAEGEEPEEGTAVDEEDGIKADDWTALAIDHRLTPSPASQEIEKGTTAAIIYKLERYTSKTGEWTGFGGQTVQFEATGGTVAPTSAVTAQDGTVAITFTPEDEATEGKVTGSTSGKDPDPWVKVSSATIKIKSEEEPCVVDDPDLQKANQLDNGYVVKNTKTGETETRSYNPDYSEWKKTTDFIDFQLNDEVVDAEGNLDTKGMLYGHIPLTMADVVLSLTGQQFENTPGAKVGFGLYDKFFVSTDFMCTSGEGGSMTTEGEIKPDGKSKIMIRKPCNQKKANTRRAPGDGQEDDYTGEYELLYYLVFTTNAYNPETQQSEEVELEIYGKGTMVMHVPSITSFVARTEKDWVRVGESTKVTVEQYYEEGATWDWSDVQLIGQSTDYTKARNGENEGFFSWDAATQTLTSLKSNDNKRVNVCLGLISNPEVKYTLMINTGEGWKYTMIKTSQEEITTHANSYPSFSFDWSPKESEDEKMDFNALELDPDCAPAGYFQFPTSYANQGWPVHVNSNCVPGEYTLRFRVKSNHDVNCTMKFIITAEE